jgi:hypothetical protein
MKFGYLNIINGRGPIQGNISNYPGSWPKIVIQYLKKNGYMRGAILEPFSGKSNLDTIKMDINPGNKPCFVGAAQRLPFKDNSFGSAILDPPYRADYSKDLYNTKMPNIKECMKETARCVRSGGSMAVLCFKNMPAYKNMFPTEKIFVNLGPDRHIRCLNIYEIKKELSSKLSDF